uniref:Uncharacterized protein n=1 Tax=Anguilla anguilla TaxID=7936 RepID=A0A0E9U743_ANGAN
MIVRITCFISPSFSCPDQETWLLKKM